MKKSLNRMVILSVGLVDNESKEYKASDMGLPLPKNMPDFSVKLYKGGAVVVKFVKDVRPLLTRGKAFKVGDRNVGPHFPAF